MKYFLFLMGGLALFQRGKCNGEGGAPLGYRSKLFPWRRKRWNGAKYNANFDGSKLKSKI
jgi:hypothetical protein